MSMSQKTERNVLIFAGSFLFGMAATPAIITIYEHNTRSVIVGSAYSSYTGVLVTHHAPPCAEADIGITMPCGNKFRLRKGEPFPPADIPCPCGDTNHWLFQRK